MSKTAKESKKEESRDVLHERILRNRLVDLVEAKESLNYLLTNPDMPAWQRNVILAEALDTLCSVTDIVQPILQRLS